MLDNPLDVLGGSELAFAPNARITLRVEYRDDDHALGFITVQDRVGKPFDENALNSGFDARMHVRLSVDTPDGRP